MLAAVMAMLQSTCYAGTGMSTVDAQQGKESQANFRWEAVNQEAQKITVENSPAEVTEEKAVPIIITASDVDAMRKKRNHPQTAALGPSLPATGIEPQGGQTVTGSGGTVASAGTGSTEGIAGAASSAVQNPVENGRSQEQSGTGAYTDVSGGRLSGADSGNRAYGTADAAMGGHTAVDDSDSDLKIYPLSGSQTAGAEETPGSLRDVQGGKVAALPEVEPVEPVADVVPLPPIQPVGSRNPAARVQRAENVVELPPIEEIAQNSSRAENKTVELPPIRPVK